MYEYFGKVIKVYDADTITVNLDLGFNVYVKKSIRLANIDAPEVRGKQRPKGLIARDYLRNLILGKDIIIKTKKNKTGKYGRYIGEVYLPQKGFTLYINEHLVEEGFVLAKKY